MSQISVELALLLGVEFAENFLERMSQDQRVLDFRYSSKTQCVPYIKNSLRGLMKVLDLGYLANIFNVSPGFLMLIKTKARKSGHCLKCDNHSKNLKSHFTVIHNLSESYYNSYKISFGHQSESFLPKVSQKLRLFTPLYEKTSKPLQLPSSKLEKPVLENKAKSSSSKVLNEAKNNEAKNNERKKIPEKKEEKKFIALEPNKKSLQNILAGLASEYRNKIREKGFSDLIDAQENDKEDGRIDYESVWADNRKTEGESGSGRAADDSGLKRIFNVESDAESVDGEAVSKCEICMVPVKEKDRKVHMNAHKLNEIVTCPDCTNTMRRKYLNRHIRNHHKSK